MSPQGDACCRPGTFDLLGFTHYWAMSRKGYWVVKQKTAADRRCFGRFSAIPLRHKANRVPSAYYRNDRFNGHLKCGEVKRFSH